MNPRASTYSSDPARAMYSPRAQILADARDSFNASRAADSSSGARLLMSVVSGLNVTHVGAQFRNLYRQIQIDSLVCRHVRAPCQIVLSKHCVHISTRYL